MRVTGPEGALFFEMTYAITWIIWFLGVTRVAAETGHLAALRLISFARVPFSAFRRSP